MHPPENLGTKLLDAVNSEIDADSLYDQAAAYATQYKMVTCSGLQRNLQIGYSLALHLKEMLEKEGVVQCLKPRNEPERIVIKTIHSCITRRMKAKQVPASSENALLGTSFSILHDRHPGSGQTRRSKFDAELPGAHIVVVFATALPKRALETNNLIAAACASHTALSIFAAHRSTHFSSLLPKTNASYHGRPQLVVPDAHIVLPRIVPREHVVSSSVGINRILQGLSHTGAIRVGLNDFRYALTGNIRNGGAIVRLAGSEASGPERSRHAVTRLLASPVFRAHLRSCNGIYCSIASNRHNLMGKEVTHICAEIRKLFGPRCALVVSIDYDQALEPDTLRVDLLASRWGASATTRCRIDC